MLEALGRVHRRGGCFSYFFLPPIGRLLIADLKTGLLW